MFLKGALLDKILKAEEHSGLHLDLSSLVYDFYFK